MTSPRGKAPHAVVLVAGPVRAHLHRIPGHSHAKRVLPRGRVLYPVQVALLDAVFFGAAKLGLTMAFVASGMAIWGTVGGYPIGSPLSSMKLTPRNSQWVGSAAGRPSGRCIAWGSETCNARQSRPAGQIRKQKKHHAYSDHSL